VLTVTLLADRPELRTALARLRWAEWGAHHPGREDLRVWIDLTRDESGTGSGLPVTFVAVDAGGEVAGGVGLIAVEYPDHPGLADRGPWVVGTVVRADLRSRGIGALLMARLAQWAAEAGIDRLWVATGGRAVEFYRRCGYAFTGTAELASGEQVTVLST
jgi:GNAT superfamily N-acetyltransferase